MSDRYEIRAKIGAGGMGAVYCAFDRELKREVAIKRLLPQHQKDEEARKTAEFLIHEAGQLSKLQHPNIVTVYDCGVDAEGGFVVMELINGETLNETIKRGALPMKDFASVVEQSLEGLIAAQEVGMLHRDLKPTNVMIRWFPSGNFQLKLLDFGLAKVTNQPVLQTIDHGSSILGSIYFMSPEQLEREPLDARTDIYSLGCLLYYCLAGRFPFRGKTAPEVMVAHLEHDVAPLGPIRPDVPASICAWVMRMMARSRDDRPADARSALREFEAALATAPRKNPGTATGSVPVPPSPRPRLITAGTGARRGTRPSVDTGSQRVLTAAVLRPLHRVNRNRGWVWPLSAVAAVAVVAGAYLVWVPDGDSTPSNANDREPGSSRESRSGAPVVLPVEDPDAELGAVLLPFGSAWNYPPPGTPPAHRWEQASFDDRDWESGPSPIGYGDQGLRTEIDVSAFGRNRPMVLYYRTHFNLAAAPPSGSFADVQVVADDGAAVFLNGIEIARVGLPAGPLAHDTPTVRRLEDTSEGWLTRTRFSTSVLVAGTNCLAVRVHQINPTSSDSWFDLKLGLCVPGAAGSPHAAPVEARDLLEIVPTSESGPQAWQFTTTPLAADWERSALPDDLASTGRGLPASPDFPAQGPRIPWQAENLWMTRTFQLEDADVRAPEHIALKILHTDAVIVFLNGRFAAERFGRNARYVLVPIDRRALDSLKPGENRLSVHARGSGSQAVDVGLVRLDRRQDTGR